MFAYFGLQLSLEVALEDRIVLCSLRKQSVLVISNFADPRSLVESVRFDFLWATDLCSHLVLHELVSLRVLQSLVLIREAQLLKRLNLLFETVVVSCSDRPVELAVVGLEKGTLKYVFSLTLGQLTLEKHVAFLPD